MTVAASLGHTHHKRLLPRCKPLSKPPVPNQDVENFLATVRATKPPASVSEEPHRILFALDATASREPTWDLAMSLHAELFQAVADEGASSTQVAVQLVYYRGYNEFHALPWSTSPASLLQHMTGVACRGGMSQIGRVLGHTLAESKRAPVKAAVFVGDACEEPPGEVNAAAGRLALFKVPLFVFQEGHDPIAGQVFRSIARITGGAHAPFTPGSADQLRALFGAVARYATHGRDGVREIDHDVARGLLAQLPR